MDGETAFTLILDDPSGNSYIETPAGSHEKDPLLSAGSLRAHGGAS